MFFKKLQVAFVESIVVFCIITLVITPLLGKAAESVYRGQTNDKMAKTGIEFYAPTKNAGRFTLEGYAPLGGSGGPDDTPPYIEFEYLHFGSPSITAAIFKRPPYYKDENCDYGDTEPVPTFLNPTPDTPYVCHFIATSPKGRKIYGYIQAAVYKDDPDASPESYFVSLGATVLSIHDLPPDFTTQDAIDVVDSFHPASPKEIEAIGFTKL